MLTRLTAICLLLVVVAGVLVPLGAAEAHGTRPAQSAPVCDYYTKLTQLFALLNDFALLNIDANVPLGAQLDTLQTSYDQLSQVVSGVQQLTPPQGFAEYHAEILGGMQAMQSALGELISSVKAGATPSVSVEDLTFGVLGVLLTLVDADGPYKDQVTQFKACTPS